MEVHQRDVIGAGRCTAILALLAAGLTLGGCAASTQQVMAPRYTITMPGSWQVKAQGKLDGQATVVVIGPEDPTLVDEGLGAVTAASKQDPAQANVEVLIHAWDGSANAGDPAGLRAPEQLEPTSVVAGLLARDPTLQLSRHVLVPEQPLECGLGRLTYRLFGAQQEPLDVVSRPGWRAVIVGGKSQGSLVGVVARVPYETDNERYCKNLRNLQRQLQNLLDGMQAVVAPVVPPAPPPFDEGLDTKPTL